MQSNNQSFSSSQLYPQFSTNLSISCIPTSTRTFPTQSILIPIIHHFSRHNVNHSLSYSFRYPSLCNFSTMACVVHLFRFNPLSFIADSTAWYISMGYLTVYAFMCSASYLSLYALSFSLIAICITSTLKPVYDDFST